jgi:hypothetical protein
MPARAYLMTGVGDSTLAPFASAKGWADPCRGPAARASLLVTAGKDRPVRSGAEWFTCSARSFSTTH